jgi:hypothetical protein
MHNLAEVYLAQAPVDPDKETLAAELQKEILSVVETHGSAGNDEPSSPQDTGRRTVEMERQPPIDKVRQTLSQQQVQPQKKQESDYSPPYTFSTRRKKKT